MVKEGQREDRGAKGRRRVKTVRKVGRTEVCLHRRRAARRPEARETYV